MAEHINAMSSELEDESLETGAKRSQLQAQSLIASSFLCFRELLYCSHMMFTAHR